MFISGFTIIKNAVINDYPIVEAISSILPVVDEMVVLVGDCEDATEALIRSIVSDKIIIHHSVWDRSIRTGGSVLAVETNKAFEKINPNADWAFYIQADEVVPENYHAEILDKARIYKDDAGVEGLLFRYLHFYGSYDYVADSRRWYKNEVRVIKNNKAIRSYRDAQGFRVGNRKLWVKPVDAAVHHYGWVKDPVLMNQKKTNSSQYWDPESEPEIITAPFDYSQFDSIITYKGDHPEVMKNRIERKNWKVELDIKKKNLSLKDRILYWIEKITGIRPFTFRNYKLRR